MTGPIAARLVKAIVKQQKAKTIDFQAFREGNDQARLFEEGIRQQEDFTDTHPAHAMLAHAQNRLSVLVEIVTSLREMRRFSTVIEQALETYAPQGPPCSPLTNSFFSAWAYYDLHFGLRK